MIQSIIAQRRFSGANWTFIEHLSGGGEDVLETEVWIIKDTIFVKVAAYGDKNWRDILKEREEEERKKAGL